MIINIIFAHTSFDVMVLQVGKICVLDLPELASRNTGYGQWWCPRKKMELRTFWLLSSTNFTLLSSTNLNSTSPKRGKESIVATQSLQTSSKHNEDLQAQSADPASRNAGYVLLRQYFRVELIQTNWVSLALKFLTPIILTLNV